ncbi:MAG: hypothetical protein ACRD2U_13445 [Terriglobales bacterium]
MFSVAKRGIDTSACQLLAGQIAVVETVIGELVPPRKWMSVRSIPDFVRDKQKINNDIYLIFNEIAVTLQMADAQNNKSRTGCQTLWATVKGL